MDGIKLDLTMDDLRLLDLATTGDVDVDQQKRLDELHKMFEDTLEREPGTVTITFTGELTS